MPKKTSASERKEIIFSFLEIFYDSNLAEKFQMSF
jgi:hypothetical protein